MATPEPRVSPELSLFIASVRSGHSPLSSGGEGDSSGNICVGSGYKRSNNHYADWRTTPTATDLNSPVLKWQLQETAATGPACCMSGWHWGLITLRIWVFAFLYRRRMKQAFKFNRARLSSPFKTASVHHKPISTFAFSRILTLTDLTSFV